MYVVTFDEKEGKRKLEIIEHDIYYGVRGIFGAKDRSKCELAIRKIHMYVSAETKTKICSPEFEKVLSTFPKDKVENLFPSEKVWCGNQAEIYSPKGDSLLPSNLEEGGACIVRDAYNYKWYWLQGISYGGEATDYSKCIRYHLIYADQKIPLGNDDSCVPAFLNFFPA